DETIIALNDLNEAVAFKRCEQQLPVGVVSRLDDHLASIARGMAREPPGLEQVDVLRDGAQSVSCARSTLRNRLRQRSRMSPDANRLANGEREPGNASGNDNA